MSKQRWSILGAVEGGGKASEVGVEGQNVEKEVVPAIKAEEVLVMWLSAKGTHA